MVMTNNTLLGMENGMVLSHSLKFVLSLKEKNITRRKWLLFPIAC